MVPKLLSVFLIVSSVRSFRLFGFEDKVFIIEGRLEEFRRLCMEAYQRGDTALDISEYSMQKFKDQSPAARRAEHERQSQR